MKSLEQNNECNQKALGYINESFESWAKRSPIRRLKNRIQQIKAEMEEKGISKERLKILIERLDFCYKMLKYREFINVLYI